MISTYSLSTSLPLLEKIISFSCLAFTVLCMIWLDLQKWPCPQKAPLPGLLSSHVPGDYARAQSVAGYQTRIQLMILPNNSSLVSPTIWWDSWIPFGLVVYILVAVLSRDRTHVYKIWFAGSQSSLTELRLWPHAALHINIIYAIFSAPENRKHCRTIRQTWVCI